MIIMAIDPGRNKCGIAVLSDNGNVLFKAIVGSDNLKYEIISNASTYAASKVIIGSGTGSERIRGELQNVELPFDVEFMNEAFSTLDAKRRYFRDNPPFWLLRILPVSLLVPPRPIDDYAAVVIGERYIANPSAIPNK